MYEAESQETILKRLQKNTGDRVSTYEGTFANDVLASNSIEFYKQEVEREEMYKSAFAETASGDYLTLIAEDHGVTRKEATAAVGNVVVKGNGTIPVGTLFQTESGISFTTTTTTAVKNEATIPVQCTEAGTVGNVGANTVTVIPMSIPGIISVTNPEPMTDGFDQESDDDLYERFHFHVTQPATSGNCNDYIEWASSIAGVGHVKVLPIWNGPGTVKVLVTDANGEPASPALLNKVITYIESVRPIGPEVTVVAPSLFDLTIKLTVTSGDGDADYIKTMLNKYFVSRNFTGITISYAKVGNMILTDSKTGVDDYSGLLINDSNGNISITDDQIPHVKEVVFQ